MTAYKCDRCKEYFEGNPYDEITFGRVNIAKDYCKQCFDYLKHEANTPPPKFAEALGPLHLGGSHGGARADRLHEAGPAESRGHLAHEDLDVVEVGPPRYEVGHHGECREVVARCGARIACEVNPRLDALMEGSNGGTE